ncbi:MAG: glycosyltransferase family 4 protein [Patescibacteria group bacterium]
MEVAERLPLMTQKPRILYVITKANWGGAQRYVYDLATAASEGGWEAIVATGSEGELSRRLIEAGIRVETIEGLGRDIRLKDDVSAFHSLLGLIRDIQPTVVHSNSSKAGGLAALAARISGVHRIVFTAHGWAFNEDRKGHQKALIWLLHYLTVLLSHRTICVSGAMRDDARAMPLVQKKLVVIHNGIGAIPLLPRDEARQRLAPGLNTSLWIGTIAELHPTKQLHILVRAFAKVAGKNVDCSLVIMGDGQERARLEALALRLQITERVHFLGHIENASSYLPAVDIFVLPSRSEGLGYVLLEAGMAGLPVVATNVGGIPEVIQHKETGILVRSGDVDELASSIEQLLTYPDLRARFGTALKERIVEKFSKTEMIEKTFGLYA